MSRNLTKFERNEKYKNLNLPHAAERNVVKVKRGFLLDKEMAPKVLTEEEQQKNITKAAESKDFDTVNKGLEEMLKRFKNRKQGANYKNSSQVLKDMFFKEETKNLEGIIDRDKTYCNKVQNDYQVGRTKTTTTRLDNENKTPTMIALKFMKSHLDEDAKKGVKQSKIVREPEVTLKTSQLFSKRQELWQSSKAEVTSSQTTSTPAAKNNATIIGKALLANSGIGQQPKPQDTSAKNNAAILGKALLANLGIGQQPKAQEPMTIDDL